MKNQRIIDMAGSVFGEWIVIEKAGNSKGGAALWRCRCSCGSERVVVGGDLRSGKSVSCGCKGSRSTIGERSATHRMKGSRIHTCWSNMLARCRNPANKNYGGKGIAVCDEWLSFKIFYEWAKDSGYQENLTIERKDNSQGYSPENCTWATRKRQARNRSIVHMRDNDTSWAEVAEAHGVPVSIMNNRVSAGGWSHEKAATIPVGSAKEPVKRSPATGQFEAGKKWRR